MAEFSSLLTLVKLFQKGQQLGSSDVAALLYSLNTAELRAALQALNDARRSASPEREYEHAVGILRSCYEKSLILADDYSLVKQAAVCVPIVGWFIKPRFLQAAQQAIVCSMLMISYYVAKNESTIVKVWIGKLNKAVELYHKQHVQYAMDVATSGSAPVSASSSIREEAGAKAEKEIEQLKCALDEFKAGLRR